MSGQCEFHQRVTDLVKIRRFTSKLLFQLPLWSILPFQPTFRCRIHAFKNDPADSLYTHGKYLGAQKETRWCVCMMNDAA
jgi:hypothetical protein